MQRFAMVHTAERAESDKSILVAMTFFELIEDSILFGVRAVLEENLHDVMMFGLGVNFGFELNFTRGISQEVLLDGKILVCERSYKLTGQL